MKLPLRCTVDYINNFLNTSEAQALFNELINNYQIDKARMVKEAGGKLIETDGFKIIFLTQDLKNQNSHPEEIHGKSFVFNGEMAKLKKKVEHSLNRSFDLAMCLYYPDGSFYAPYHSDQQTAGEEHTILPSISIGEEREFSFRRKATKRCYNLMLANGSILIMGAHCQSRYEHSLLKDPKYTQSRINITFRDRNFQ